MNCMEARRMVTPFVKKELSDKETEAFLNHIGHCSECMDELDIYYTVYHVLNLLDSEEHQEYDFRNKLEEDIRSTKKNLLRKHVAQWLRVVGCLVTEALLLMTVISGMRVRAGAGGLLEKMLLRIQLVSEAPETELQSGGEPETEIQSGAEPETELQSGAESEAE